MKFIPTVQKMSKLTFRTPPKPRKIPTPFLTSLSILISKCLIQKMVMTFPYVVSMRSSRTMTRTIPPTRTVRTPKFCKLPIPTNNKHKF